MHRRIRQLISAGCCAVSIGGAAMIAVAQPASAAGNHLCETNGSFCVGAPNLALFDPITETASGRVINAISQGSNHFLLQLNANTSDCVAGANNGVDVVIHPCNGGVGIVWVRHLNANGHSQYESQEFPGDYLAGHDNGTQFQLKPLGLSGWFYNFDLG